jgi:hypothetical protein
MPTIFPEDKGRGRNRRKRALLDSNIWRYVVDNKSQGALLHVARDGAYDVQIAPGVLYETLRLEDTLLRATLVRLMTNSRFYSESMEILREIERARPDWLRAAPDLQFANRLMKDWNRKMGGFWVRCARSPESEARFLGRREREMIEGAQTQTELARKEMIRSGWKRNPSMDKTLAGFPHPVPGWRGDMVEAWRMDSLIGLTDSLARTETLIATGWPPSSILTTVFLLAPLGWSSGFTWLRSALYRGNGCAGHIHLHSNFARSHQVHLVTRSFPRISWRQML